MGVGFKVIGRLGIPFDGSRLLGGLVVVEMVVVVVKMSFSIDHDTVVGKTP